MVPSRAHVPLSTERCPCWAESTRREPRGEAVEINSLLFSSFTFLFRGYSGLQGKIVKQDKTPNFSFSSSHSPYLYLTLCSHSSDCAFPLLMRFSLGPRLRLSSGWADWGYFTMGGSQWQPLSEVPPMLVLGLRPHSSCLPPFFSSLHPAPEPLDTTTTTTCLDA